MRTFITILFIAYCFYSFINITATQDSTPVAPNVHPDPNTMINDGQSLLKEGDLVVRLNQDPASRFIKNFNRRDKNYSHAGIVLYKDGYPYIYHIVNGEENPGEKLRKDSLSRFCNPRKNTAYGIFRYEMKNGEIKSLKDQVLEWYEKGVRFDFKFNLKTDDRMYCSEMISKALARATGKRIMIKTTQPTHTEAGIFSLYMHLPLTYTIKLQIVSIDDLYTNPYCRLVKEYSYKKHEYNNQRSPHIQGYVAYN
ncbi:MAG: YiiX/YebB-like N1pC/P60 family cysteine hydrolase [Chitinophagaceae bacterium]